MSLPVPLLLAILKSQVNASLTKGARTSASRSLNGNALTAQLTALVLAAVGLGLGGQSAIAQRQQLRTVRDPNTGAVRIDQNAFDLKTGNLTNTSNIPLPAGLPTGTSPERALDTGFVDGQLAPNSVDLTTDFNFIG